MDMSAWQLLYIATGVAINATNKTDSHSQLQAKYQLLHAVNVPQVAIIYWHISDRIHQHKSISMILQTNTTDLQHIAL